MIVRERNQPGRTSVARQQMAMSILAIAFLTACGGGKSPTQSAATTATQRPSAVPTATATPGRRPQRRREPTPSPNISPLPLPGGRIVYIALDQDGVGTLVTTNPDGTDTTPLLPGNNPPRWSPDGRHISVVADDADDHLFLGLVDPDGSNYVQFDNPDPTLELDCHAWSPDGLRLACSGFDGTDVSRNGIYTVRSSDGSDLTRVTTNPDGYHDIPSDYSPDGRQIVFARERIEADGGDDP